MVFKLISFKLAGDAALLGYRIYMLWKFVKLMFIVKFFLNKTFSAASLLLLLKRKGLEYYLNDYQKYA